MDDIIQEYIAHLSVSELSGLPERLQSLRGDIDGEWFGIASLTGRIIKPTPDQVKNRFALRLMAKVESVFLNEGEQRMFNSYRNTREFSGHIARLLRSHCMHRCDNLATQTKIYCGRFGTIYGIVSAEPSNGGEKVGNGLAETDGDLPAVLEATV